MKAYIALFCLMAVTLAEPQSYRGKKKSQPCTTTEDCNGRSVCNTENNRCVKCVQDSDCKTGRFCFVFKCLPMRHPCAIQEPGQCLWDGAGARNGDIKFRTVDQTKENFMGGTSTYQDMITAVAKMKYGQNLADFLVAHLPKKDGSGTVDYDIQDVNALNDGDCIRLRGAGNGKFKGAVGQVFDDEKIFQFRYMDVTMLKIDTDEDGNVIKETFTLKKLEVIGRIVPDGLDIETCRCEVDGGIGNTFCADLQVKLGVRMRFLECLGNPELDGAKCAKIG